VHALVASGRFPLVDKHVCVQLIGPDTVGMNASHVPEVDGADPESISRALPLARRTALQAHEALREMNPRAYTGSFLSATGASLGVRETRRVAGEYALTMEDYLARRSFPDEIGRNCYCIDVHRSAPGDPATNDRQFYQKGESHGIPYRCLLPKGFANLLVAGRCISTDREVQGSIRTMPCCLVTGEAAGLAAALALSAGGGPDARAVDPAALRARLRAHGAYLP
jgi:hypothetical protein